MPHMTKHNIRAARIAARLTLREVAAELGIAESTLSRAENYGVPLSRYGSPADAIAAIERIVARREVEAKK